MNMTKEWMEYLSILKEANSFKNRIRTYVKDRNDLIGVGGQDNSPPYTQKMTKHVTFDKQLQEIAVDAEGFRVHDTLEGQMWQDEKLNPEVRERLLKIANEFIDGLPVEVDMEDVTLTGSLANFNWSKYSDVDLHIIVNFAALDENIDLVKAFFDAQRMRWNDLHDIKIHGYDVEIYVENSKETHLSTGVYSIMNDEWLTHPEAIERDIDLETAKKKAEDIDDRYEKINKMYKDGHYRRVLKNVDRLKQKIKDMRSAGLESDEMEFSPENIAFKLLRRSSILNKLSKLKYNAYDDLRSMEQE
jgi:predicted nucleotidyltransferase